MACLKKWLYHKIKISNSNNLGDTNMPTTIRSPKKESVDNFIDKYNDYVVKRVGNDIVLVDAEHTHVLTGTTVEARVKSLVQGKSKTRIRTAGLSRGQVAKLAGSFIDSDTVVEVRHVPRSESSSSRLQRFEILIKEGK